MKILSIILFMFFYIPLFAQKITTVNVQKKSGIAKPQVYAVVIGINKYQSLPSLGYASSDALNFYKLLVSPVFNVIPANIFLLTDSSASRSNVYKAMYDLEEKLQPNDLLIYYFAGHGDIEAKIQTNSSLLLLPQCPSKNYLRSAEHLDMSTLKDYFESLTNKKVRSYFICDACHSGNLIGGIEGQRLTSLNLQQSWANEVKLLSCQPNELSQEGLKWGNGRGIFSYYLELACMGMADNGDERISLGEIKKYVESQVASGTYDKQNPLILGDPKIFICNVDEKTLSSLKTNSASIVRAMLLPDIKSRGINQKRDSILDFYQEQLKKQPQLPMLNDNVVIIASNILKDVSLKEFWASTEKQLFEYCNDKFNELIQHYYDGVRMQAYQNELHELSGFLQKALPIFNNNFYKKDIYVKLRFTEIELATISPNLHPKNLLEQFIKTLFEIKEISPSSPFIYKMLSEILYGSGKFDESYKEAINYTYLLPNDPYAYNFAGMALFKTQKQDKAIEALQKAILLKPDFYEAYYNLGIVYNQIGEKAAAKRAFDKANELRQPKHVDE